MVHLKTLRIWNGRRAPDRLAKSFQVDHQSFITYSSVKMQGFIVSNYQEHFPEGVKQLSQWLNDGKLVKEETVVEGFDSIPQAFIDLFEGKNKGKMVVKIY